MMDERRSCCLAAETRDAAPARDPATAPVSGTAASPRGDVARDIVWLPGGRTYAGTTEPLIAGDGEERRPVRLAPFGIARHAVSNAGFAAFVDATGYVTEAERFGWSFVFEDALPAAARIAAQRVVATPWWCRIEGATWRHPAGPGSAALPDHPVVHATWRDASAFAAWAGGRLPSEAEWEFAARGGGDGIYPWGDEDPPDDRPLCNNWQGRFPGGNTAADGHAATAPVDSFAANGYGLHNMAGNTWEWCADAFRVRSLTRAGKARDQAARATDDRVLKGGSYLCHRSYCHRYRIAARMGVQPDTSTAHIGFRLCFDPSPQG